jgi:hypothetical protein
LDALRRIALIVSACAGAAGVAAAAEPPSSPWWAGCVALRDDQARLACFDARAPALPTESSSTAAPVPAAAAPAVAAAPVVARQPPAEAAPLGIRLAVGYGLGIADYAGRLHAVNHGYFDISSGIGSAGGTFYGQAWLDGLPTADWTAGVEYLQFRDTTHAALTLPQGISVLTDGITAHADAVVFARMLLLNVAWRPQTIGPLRPSIGAGLGAGRATASASVAVQSPFFGQIGATPETSFPFGAVQGFAGIEYAIVDGIYVALEPRVIWVSGHPLGKDQRYLDFVMSTAVGVNF